MVINPVSEQRCGDEATSVVFLTGLTIENNNGELRQGNFAGGL